MWHMCKRQTITAFSIINIHRISSYMIWKFSCQVGVSKYPLTSLKILKKLLTKKKIHLQKKRGGGEASQWQIFLEKEKLMIFQVGCGFLIVLPLKMKCHKIFIPTPWLYFRKIRTNFRNIFWLQVCSDINFDKEL